MLFPILPRLLLELKHKHLFLLLHLVLLRRAVLTLKHGSPLINSQIELLNHHLAAVTLDHIDQEPNSSLDMPYNIILAKILLVDVSSN